MNSRQRRQLTHIARKLGINIPEATETKSPSHTVSTSPAAQKEDKEPLNGLLSMGWKWLVAILTILGGIATVNALRYDVSIDPYASFNPKEPLETRFVLANQGPYSIYSVTYQCEFPDMKLLGVNPNINLAGTEIVAFEEPAMEARGKISLRCESPMTPADGSILQIRVSYRPSSWPLRTEGSSAFMLKRDSAGNVVWLPRGRAKSLTEPKK
jgi:hypothetical protein